MKVITRCHRCHNQRSVVHAWSNYIICFLENGIPDYPASFSLLTSERCSTLHLYKSTTFLLSMYINQFSSLPWHNFCNCFVICFSSVNEPATDGTTPVYLASQDGNLECLKYLHSVGGKCDARARDGMLPVHGAAQNGHLDCIAYLVCWF